jgi:formate hydrogenlyase transcriptional activator
MNDKTQTKIADRRLNLERLVSDLSVRFVNLSPSQVDDEIETSLQRVVDFLKVDLGAMDMLEDDGKIRRAFVYTTPGVGITVATEDINIRFPWYTSRVQAGEFIAILRIPEDFPEEAAAEQEFCTMTGVKVLIVLPIKLGNSILGALYFLSKRGSKQWSPDLVQRFIFIGEIFANAILRREAERVLLESEERFRALANQAPVGIFLSDWKSGILFRNKELQEITGLSSEDPSQWDWNRILHPEDRERVVAATRRLIEHGEPLKCEYRYIIASGKTVWVSTIATPFRGRDNEVKGTLGTVIDITERKEAEASLQSALAEISQLKEQLEAENIYLRKDIQMRHNFCRIVGQSEAINSVLVSIEQVAPTNSIALVLGETGTGKGLVAHAIHELSPRKAQPFITVNCAALPANLIESELFGREKGAFTGSHARQAGRFEVANHGTIFLDEIGELPLELQPKLLTVLQDGEFERLGSPHTIKVDTRVIASTSRDLKEEIRKGRFRQDLYYRLNVFPITVPPLRDRKEDIAPLVKHFVGVYAKKMGKDIKTVPKETLKALENYSWPGNVRELEHVIERAIITTSGSVLRLAESIGIPAIADHHPDQTLADVERAHILQVLEQTSWHVEGGKGAAAILGLAPSTLRSKMQKLIIDRSGNKTHR